MIKKSELPINTEFKDSTGKKFTVFDKVTYGQNAWVCLGGEKDLYRSIADSFSPYNEPNGIRLYRLEVLPGCQWSNHDCYIKPHPHWVTVVQFNILDELLTHPDSRTRAIVLKVLELHPELKGKA